MHMMQAPIDDMRDRNQGATDADQYRMPGAAVRRGRQQTGDEQQDARDQKQERKETAMGAQAMQETDAGEQDGECHEHAFEGVAREKGQANGREHAEQERQQGAMDGAQQRCQRTEAIDRAFHTVLPHAPG